MITSQVNMENLLLAKALIHLHGQQLWSNLVSNLESHVCPSCECKSSIDKSYYICCSVLVLCQLLRDISSFLAAKCSIAEQVVYSQVYRVLFAECSCLLWQK